MARKTVRVEVPSSSADEMLKLGDAILKWHKKQGKDSPLKHLNMTKLDADLTAGRSRRKEALDLYAQAKPLNDQANTLIGIADGQTSDTPETIYNMVVRTKKTLLPFFSGNEEKLSEAGFKVVIGSFAPTGKKKKPIS